MDKRVYLLTLLARDVATGKEYCLTYGDAAIGHIVNMHGEDILTGKLLEKTAFRTKAESC